MKKTLAIVVMAAGTLLTACSDGGVSSVDAACSGTVVYKDRQYGQETVTQEKRVVSFHYVRSTKRLTLGNTVFPSYRVEQSDGVISASAEPSPSGAKIERYELVKYDVKTNVLFHEISTLTHGPTPTTGRWIESTFETICKPAK